MKKWEKPALHHLNYCQTSHDVTPYSYLYKCDCCGRIIAEVADLDELVKCEEEHKRVCTCLPQS